jgi:hypothetical protein
MAYYATVERMAAIVPGTSVTAMANTQRPPELIVAPGGLLEIEVAADDAVTADVGVKLQGEMVKRGEGAANFSTLWLEAAGRLELLAGRLVTGGTISAPPISGAILHPTFLITGTGEWLTTTGTLEPQTLIGSVDITVAGPDAKATALAHLDYWSGSERNHQGSLTLEGAAEVIINTETIRPAIDVGPASRLHVPDDARFMAAMTSRATGDVGDRQVGTVDVAGVLQAYGSVSIDTGDGPDLTLDEVVPVARGQSVRFETRPPLEQSSDGARPQRKEVAAASVDDPEAGQILAVAGYPFTPSLQLLLASNTDGSGDRFTANHVVEVVASGADAGTFEVVNPWGALLASAPADESVSFDVVLREGVHELLVQTVSPAGRVSKGLATQSVVVDTTAPFHHSAELEHRRSGNLHSIQLAVEFYDRHPATPVSDLLPVIAHNGTDEFIDGFRLLRYLPNSSGGVLI